ncbi:MAG: serine protease, partial [Acidobacteriota bacterium]
MPRKTFVIIFIAFLVVVAIAAPATANKIKPTTIGEHVTKLIETTHPYQGSGEAAPALSWNGEIHHPGATYIAVHFAKFQLAPGDYAVVRSADGLQKWVYKDLGRHSRGLSPDGFFATHIKGDRAIIELYTKGENDSASPAYGFSIDRYGRGFNNTEIQQLWLDGKGEEMNLPYPRGWGESICTADDTEEAKCYENTEPAAYDQARAVARLLLNGSAHCTGWLVGSEGHLMTNEHCITSQGQTDDIDFEFMAEGATCATNCGSSLACGGTVEASGGTFVTDDGALDYALVIPDTSTGTGTDLAATYGFMRLRQSGAVLNERIYIPQHPAGWGKRFAMQSSYPDDVTLGGFAYVNSLNEAACSGGANDVGYFADTQGGSSGSPVLGYSDNRVV